MEAITVVENCEGTIDEATLKQALNMAEKSSSKNQSLTEDLIAIIRDRIK